LRRFLASAVSPYLIAPLPADLDDFGGGDSELLDADVTFAKDASRMDQDDLSAFDTTDAEGFDNHSVLGDISNVPGTPVVPNPKRAKLKRKLVKRDATTELAGKFISASLKDHSDITIQGGRPTVAFSKRQKLKGQPFSALLSRPTGLEFASEEDGLGCAPELLEMFRSPGKAGKEEEEESKEEAVEEESRLEVEADTTLDENLDFGGVDYDIDVDTTIGGMSMVGDVDEEVEQEEQEQAAAIEITYDDNLEQAREELEDFFGDEGGKGPKDKKGNKAKEGSQEELEEQGWSHRTKKMEKLLAKEMKKHPSIQLDAVLGETKNRQAAAAVFYQLLVLKSHSVVDVKQVEPYGDITISDLQISNTRRRSAVGAH
jgi:hypothetical protein